MGSSGGNKETVVSRRRLLKAGVWFAFFNSVFVFLIALKYFVLIPDSVWNGHAVYTCAYILTHFVFISFLPIFFVYLPVTILMRSNRASLICASVVMSLFLIVFALDAYIFSLYRFHINSYVLEQVFAPGSTQVFEFTIAQYFMVGGVLTALVLVEVLLFKLAFRLANRIPNNVIYTLIVVFGSLICLVQCKHAWGCAKNDRQLILLDRYFPACVSLNANSLLSAVGVEVEPTSIVVDYHGKQYRYPKSALNNTKSGKNLIVIAFDAWRASTMDSLCSPNIYAFSKRSSRFLRHYSGSNGTRTGVFSMFYGLPGVYCPDFCEQSISPVLFSTMKDKGYDVRLFPSASMLNPPLDKCVFSMFPEQCGSAPGINAWQRDVNVVNAFLQFLNERGGDNAPFFSFLFFDSLHSMIKPEDYTGPFQPSWDCAHYERLGKDVDPTEFLNLYKNMVYYLDSLVGKVLTEVEAKGLLDSTVIVFTGDHSQEFDDCHHAFWGHNGNYSAAQMQVPMVYFNAKDTIVSDKWTSHYDLVPTLMNDLFGTTNNPSDYSIGVSLFDTTAHRDFLLVDSYIGVGMIDSMGTITNVYYDGDYSITDHNLDDQFDAPFNRALFDRAETQIKQFWK